MAFLFFTKRWFNNLTFLGINGKDVVRVDNMANVIKDLDALVQQGGSQGPQGAQGSQGVQGSQGAQGDKGAQGAQGSSGSQGSPGSQGPQGFQGTQGFQGNQGVQGSQGSVGAQGPQGFQGTQGNQGVQGSQGNQGFQGNQGSQGNQGTQGATGSQGSQGFQGNQGFQGAQGAQGSQGSQGNQGTQGNQGSQGSSANNRFVVEMVNTVGTLAQNTTYYFGPIGNAANTVANRRFKKLAIAATLKEVTVTMVSSNGPSTENNTVVLSINNGGTNQTITSTFASSGANCTSSYYTGFSNSLSAGDTIEIKFTTATTFATAPANCGITIELYFAI